MQHRSWKSGLDSEYFTRLLLLSIILVACIRHAPTETSDQQKLCVCVV